VTVVFELKVPDLRRYEKNILEYEKQPVEKGRILFCGSSGFTRWSARYGNRPLEEDIRMKDGSVAAVNHGFGGSTIEEGLYYYDRAVRPWEPRAIVLRFFPNDLAAGYTPLEIVTLLAQFCNWARADFPGVKLYICDAMPHKRTANNGTWRRFANQFNKLVREYCDANADCTCVGQSCWPGFYHDPADAGDYTKIRTDIWVEDEVHLTQEGYDMYRDLFLDALDDIL
jgi:lysophospholipase L1-like esterase